MTQEEKRIFLIRVLLEESPELRDLDIPKNEQDQRRLLRALMNVRLPGEINQDFLQIQDAYLQENQRRRGIVRLSDLSPIRDGIYLWRGDITTLACGAIVNAANSGLTGCYRPCHNCIDNCIHTYAGIQLRQECARLMAGQGFEEPTGQAKITPAYNLPCRYVIHTVGPIVDGPTTEGHCRLLSSCYRSCLEVAEENQVGSIAFCCISTGVYHFPNQRAAEIAVETVETYRVETNSKLEVIFNVFQEWDEKIYRELLG